MEAEEVVSKDWFASIVIHFPRILQTQDMSSGDGAASACRKRSQKHSPRSPFWLRLLADAIEPVPTQMPTDPDTLLGAVKQR
jgi:hypothetical protein